MDDFVLRQILDVFIYLARHMVFTFALLFIVCWIGERYRNRFSAVPLINASARWLPLVLLSVFAAIGGWYMSVDGFAGEVEPAVSSLSWLVQSGQPLYTDFDAAERYSVLYGPSVFLTNGLFLKILGPSLASAKLASVLGGLGSLLFLFAALQSERRDRLALAVTAMAALYYWTQGFAVYLVRPDALMLFAVGLGIYAAARTRRWMAILTVAVAAGFAINLKAHGAVYFLPVFVQVWRRFGRRDAVTAGLATLLVVVAPFFLYSQVSLANYINWLTNAVSHGLETETLDQTLRYAGFLLLPLISLLVAAPDRKNLWQVFRVEFLVLLPVYGLTLVLAAKPGAGPVHLLPLVPTTMYLLGTAFRAGFRVRPEVPAARPRLIRRSLLTATVVTALLAGTVNAYRAVRYVDYEIGRTPDLALDMREIMRNYPGLPLSMACGGEKLSFQATWLRPLLVFADHPLLIDPISVMDSSLSGRDLSPKTYKAISEGLVAVWLVPRQQTPFDKLNWYAPHLPLFPDSFQEHFMSYYTPRAQSRYFDLWFWNGLDDSDLLEAKLTGGSNSGAGNSGAGLMAP